MTVQANRALDSTGGEGCGGVPKEIQGRGLIYFGWVAVVLLPLTAHAAWSGYGSVSQIWSHDGYHFLNTTISDNPCGTAGKFWWPTSDADAKDMLALSMFAMASGRSIAVVYTESAPNCMYGAAQGSHLVIND